MFHATLSLSSKCFPNFLSCRSPDFRFRRKLTSAFIIKAKFVKTQRNKRHFEFQLTRGKRVEGNKSEVTNIISVKKAIAMIKKKRKKKEKVLVAFYTFILEVDSR